MNLWIVGKYIEDGSREDACVWAFQGLFDSEEKALAACRTEAYFIFPEVLNQELPQEDSPAPGAYYPHLQEKPEASMTDAQQKQIDEKKPKDKAPAKPEPVRESTAPRRSADIHLRGRP